MNVMRWEILKVAGLLFMFGGLFYAMLTVLSAPSRPSIRLGLRGLKRQRMIAMSDSWRLLEPLLRWIGVRVSGVIKEEWRKRLNDQIATAGDYLGLTADEFVGLSIISSFAGAGAGIAVGFALSNASVMFGLVGTLFGALAPYMQMQAEADERLQAIRRGLPYAIDLMSLSMGAGLDFPGSVRQVVEKASNPSDPITEEFSLALQSLSIGRTRREVLQDLAARAPIETVIEFTSSLLQAEERGNPIVEVLQIQATVSRQRKSVKAEENASKAGVAMSLPVILVFISVLILILGPVMLGLSGGF